MLVTKYSQPLRSETFQEVNDMSSQEPSQAPQNDSENHGALAKTVADTIAQYSDTMTTVIERTAQAAREGPITYLLALGTALFILACLMKMQILGQGISNIGSTEFLALLVAATLQTIMVALLKFYEFRTITHISSDQSRMAEELLSQTAEKIAQTTQAAAEKIAQTAQAAADNKPQPERFQTILK